MSDRRRMTEAVRLLMSARAELEPCCGDDRVVLAVDDVTDALEQVGFSIALLDDDGRDESS